MDEVMEGVKRFHEQDVEVKKPLYSRDPNKKVVYFNIHFHFHKARYAEWKDSLVCRMLSPDPINPKDFPDISRDIMLKYTRHLICLGDILIELLSEGLRLNPHHLKGLDCTKNLVNIGHYYPACPESELTLGGGKHSDPTFVTILLQDDIGGLQFLHRNYWVGAKPVPEALLVNIGDILQVISNKRYKSAEHRVVANFAGPRVSMASFSVVPRHPLSFVPRHPLSFLLQNSSHSPCSRITSTPPEHPSSPVSLSCHHSLHQSLSAQPFHFASTTSTISKPHHLSSSQP
ncbi:hypothetical protein MKX01_031634 [Papaver californicum]|nr:hypothetical protein MKX01_031634 [Papaver californicum]